MRLTAEQEMQFKTFGFVVLRDFFSPNELNTIRSEFDYMAERASRFEPFDGTKMHYFKMMGSGTPFYASLPEDPRFYEVAEQLFGPDTFAFESNGYRYVGNTRWHYNDGSSNIHGYGIKFQFGLQLVRGDTGALRFIPGSHKNPFQDEVAGVPPLGRRWYRHAGGVREDTGGPLLPGRIRPRGRGSLRPADFPRHLGWLQRPPDELRELLSLPRDAGGVGDHAQHSPQLPQARLKRVDAVERRSEGGVALKPPG